jgi:TrbC/VIRB2 pilin
VLHLRWNDHFDDRVRDYLSDRERTLTGLCVLLQSNVLKRVLQPYCLGGPYGRLLDAEFERLGEGSVQVFETDGLIGTAVAPAVSVEGPVAKIIAVIIIIVTGLSRAFGDTSGGFRRLIQIVFGLSIAFAASSFFLSFFSFGGGVVI